MKGLAVAFLVALMTGEAAAQEQAGFEGVSLLGSILQMVAALAVVLGIILVIYHLSSRWLRIGATPGGSSRYIRIVETRYLAPKKSLLLVEVGGEYLLMASSGDGLQFLKQIDMLEEIEVLDGQGLSRLVPGSLQNKIIDLVSRLPKRDVAAPQRAQGGARS